jgi:isopentenyl diphosphate isomerase/L-lactate dehydrogenase-like FMN-dependent dehydrogenase
VNIDDLRDLARGRLPNVVLDYLDGGAEGEVTHPGRKRWVARTGFPGAAA